MITIKIPLVDIIVDLEQDVDLTALSEDEVILHITRVYQFLPLPLDIALTDGIAIIISNTEIQQNKKMIRLLDRAATEANRGRYRQASQLYQQYLAQAPGDVAARRNLGMSYLEMGKIGPAEKHLIEALNINPQDAYSALQRFESMSQDELTAVVGEIALLGQSGLDYASPDKKYTLQNLPGENFSGLQLMCFMYVGFKDINPAVDVGMDLADPYETALKLYEA